MIAGGQATGNASAAAEVIRPRRAGDLPRANIQPVGTRRYRGAVAGLLENTWRSAGHGVSRWLRGRSWDAFERRWLQAGSLSGTRL